VNSIICSILFRKSPDEVRLFLIDPKIVELKLYNGCPHLLTPVITEPKKAFQALQYCISEMERRYTFWMRWGSRHPRLQQEGQEGAGPAPALYRHRDRRVSPTDGHDGQEIAGVDPSRGWLPWPRDRQIPLWCWPRSGPRST